MDLSLTQLAARDIARHPPQELFAALKRAPEHAKERRWKMDPDRLNRLEQIARQALQTEQDHVDRAYQAVREAKTEEAKQAATVRLQQLLTKEVERYQQHFASHRAFDPNQAQAVMDSAEALLERLEQDEDHSAANNTSK